MAEIAEVYPSKLICGILYHQQEHLDKVVAELQKQWGAVDAESEVYEFSKGSNYYEKEMGSPLYRRFISFKKLVRPELLAEQKLLTQKIEESYSSNSSKEVIRPINLDPGHITRGRMILATTKDYAHRIYLHSGIYAEVTLLFKKNNIEALPWTYPDLSSGFWDEFLLDVRKNYHKNLEPLSQ